MGTSKVTLFGMSMEVHRVVGCDPLTKPSHLGVRAPLLLTRALVTDKELARVHSISKL